MEIFKKYTILYIEDDDGVRNINSRFLNRMFNELYEAKDGEEGYALYKKYHPDIILTDIKMPKLDGISLTKKIRQKDKTTKIIISTAFSEKEYLIDAIELNIEKYIIKPLTSRNLMPALTKAIEALEKQKDFKIFLAEDFYFDNNTSLFYYKEKVIDFTKKELQFLKLLTLNKDRVVSYEEIEQNIWEDEYMSLNSLRTSIGFIRKKIPFNCIKNISNMGYKLNLEK
ncbi:response regulator transcription factor [Aliarcobacter butzleri]|uniref:Two-component response regulator n=1 Tax=Aliarcobacter butzleri (strain RM4018) TaxID=367737 RepID=A8ER12_ALIB4|nr:response regulator transcription factor [Aliarcobacter butzleri]ABV66386.1 two-component response regulator [Aliarcobacter butzleri RM4018]RZV14053.1 DNA-binding response regulator [Aliarcobacter butzleri]RZV19513.1 DNA-binding response regulator [Aliarcobacter butzleri]SNV23081.1 Staphylococcal respiratory response protein A [Aliarcobacter butzleri]GGT76366.1 two-component system response regulator [Aliarcobacter butzleri]